PPGKGPPAARPALRRPGRRRHPGRRHPHGSARLMYVVATAGHVDHGKSTLVRALTGMEPDRWADERRPGMTVDLGYAWMTLPAGARGSEAGGSEAGAGAGEKGAFLDVPGHERFVPNRLAGLGPVPAVMFVV